MEAMSTMSPFLKENIVQVIIEPDIKIFQAATQTRDFNYGEDVTSALIATSKSSLEGEIINIGSDNTYSINQVVELLGGEAVYIPKRPGEPDSTWADISKAKKLLDWSPAITIEKGIKNLLDNIDYWSEAPDWDADSISEATKKWFDYLG